MTNNTKDELNLNNYVDEFEKRVRQILSNVPEKDKARQIVNEANKLRTDAIEQGKLEECKREHIPERVHDYKTKEQFEIFIQRLQEKIEWLEGLKREAQTIIKSLSK